MKRVRFEAGGETLHGLAPDRSRDVDGRVRVVDERKIRISEIGEAITKPVDLLIDRVVTDGFERQLEPRAVFEADFEDARAVAQLDLGWDGVAHTFRRLYVRGV